MMNPAAVGTFFGRGHVHPRSDQGSRVARLRSSGLATSWVIADSPNGESVHGLDPVGAAF
jgi:hypothetical protein